MKLHTILWITPFICFLSGYYLLHSLYGVTTLPTPCIMGNTVDQAVCMLSEKNLNLRIITQQIDTDLPDGTIVDQTPAPGTQIKPHQALYVVVARQPEPVHAPHCVGTNKQAIMQKLSKSAVKPQFFYLDYPYPTDHCFAQHPKPGQPLHNNKLICYIARTKRQNFLMPDLRGTPLDQAQLFFEHYPITLQVVQDTVRTNSSENTTYIADQRPLPGASVTFDKQHPLAIQLLINNRQ